MKKIKKILTISVLSFGLLAGTIPFAPTEAEAGTYNPCPPPWIEPPCPIPVT
ncbi:hypothetical protein [Bacillus solimangrovi]|uniref:hypothetical protein n=1 Tax=Bacillus solimangrovi TaxID=1305675 RepID=UPI001586A5CE|nr:hypothetical protein [Bacillus solimangrovi]